MSRTVTYSWRLAKRAFRAPFMASRKSASLARCRTSFLEAPFILFLCVCACIDACSFIFRYISIGGVWAYVSACMWRPEENLEHHHHQKHHLPSLRQRISLICSVRPDWLASEPQRFFYICFLVSGSFRWSLEVKLRTSCLWGKHRTGWTVISTLSEHIKVSHISLGQHWF